MDFPSRNFWWLQLLALASGCLEGSEKQVLEPAFPPCPMYEGRIQYTQHARATLLEWNAMAWIDCEG